MKYCLLCVTLFLILHHTKSRNHTRIKMRHTPSHLLKPGRFNVTTFLEGILKDAKLLEQKNQVITEKVEINEAAEAPGQENVMRREDDREELLYDIEDGGLQNPLFK
nr:uncharacterized protein LOC126054469 [Helicoverpa armigera]